MFKVQTKQCPTCIYLLNSPLNLDILEGEIRDGDGFKSYRICHHSHDVCCRGFWDRHKDKFQLGRIAQRLGLVQFVSVDTRKK